MTQINYPFGFDSRGHTAETNEEKHIRDLIEQVLFTSPGERVNRPSFGSGLLQLIFAPNSDVLAAATQNEDSTLQVLVQYTVRRTQQRQVAQFVRGGL